MTHWLIELPLAPENTPGHDAAADRAGSSPVGALRTLATTALADAGAEIIESQTATDPPRLFMIVSADDPTDLSNALDAAGLEHLAPAAVRLVGASVEELPTTSSDSRWLVEWDLPEGLTMDAYLDRKQANSPKYADVPEVSFQRTWVREDMQKCLCFYDGPDEAAIRRARDVVGAPVDRLHPLDGA